MGNNHVDKGVTLETHPLVAPSSTIDEMVETRKSNDSDRTVSGSVSTDSERTPVRVDSQDSQVSDGEAVERTWPRQNSVSCFKLNSINNNINIPAKHILYLDDFVVKCKFNYVYSLLISCQFLIE